MYVYILVVLAIAITVGCILPTRKASPEESPLCPKPSNTDKKYQLTLKYAKDILPYCDEIDTNEDLDEDW